MNDTTKTVIGLLARRLATGAGVFLVAHGGLASGDQVSFVQIGSGIILWAAEAGLEWWRTNGKVLVDAKLAQLRGVHPDQNPQGAKP